MVKHRQPTDAQECQMSEQEPDVADQLARMNAVRGELAERMEIELTQVTLDRVTGRMPVAGNRQPYGLLHGGASAVLAETLGSFHAATVVAPEGTAVGLELSCTHHRGARDGFVTGESTAIFVGRTVATFEIVVSNEAGERVCTARLTCVLRRGTA
ncbi:hotdog fold thioesterase [Nakamurella sp. PAMC28650]|nr:hotdog fold thioesterase [Nakamurella sp. PAMC28650]